MNENEAFSLVGFSGRTLTLEKSVDHLQSHDNAGYVNTSRGLYFKPSANPLTRKHRSSESSSSYTSKYVISCTIVK
jgi:hypothetical protein